MSARAIRLAFALPLLALVACGSAEERARPRADVPSPPANRAPRLESLHIEPAAPRAGEPIELLATASDPDGQPVRIRFIWRLRGVLLERTTRPFLETTRLVKGDSLELTAVADDGRLESEPLRRFVVIANSAPELREVELIGEEPLRPGDPLLAAPLAHDRDGDRVRFHYEWFVDGRPQPEGRRRFVTRRLRRGQRVHVRVTASDGDLRSPAVESESIEIANSPPRFAGVPAARRRGELWIYPLEASDPDGDRRLRYRLENGPAGMGIDPVLGELVWRPDVAQAGMHTVKVRVEDAYGDGTSMRFRIHAAARVYDFAPPASQR